MAIVAWQSALCLEAPSPGGGCRHVLLLRPIGKERQVNSRQVVQEQSREMWNDRKRTEGYSLGPEDRQALDAFFTTRGCRPKIV